MKGEIYRIINIENRKCYVGQTVSSAERKYEHFRKLVNGKHTNIKLQNAFSKYGESNFKFEILEDQIPVEELDRREIYWIKKLNSHSNGYNMSDGGFGNNGAVDSGRFEFEWNGIKYRSMREAAEALGVSVPAMSKRKKNGYKCDADLANKRRDFAVMPEN